MSKSQVVVIGAGPAGLTASYELSKAGIGATVLEADSVVGGIARTASYKNYLFDIGGHRFFTKVRIVENLWDEVLGQDMLTRKRSSRILYRGRFFRYPLEPIDALLGLGPVEAAHCVLSYLSSKLSPATPELDFETWISNRFGRRLFKIFFETYTEKVWGIPCKEIQAEWAAQRIKDLSLSSLIKEAMRPSASNPDKANVIKTLVHEFRYPRLGPGMLWERISSRVQTAGHRILLDHPVERILWEPGRVTGVVANGKTFEAGHYISTMPIRDLVERLEPEAPAVVRAAIGGLNYRDFITVAVIVKDRHTFQDNWIYIHDPGVKVGRIQNFKSWSPEMVPEPGNTCLGMEYFCTEGDHLWNATNAELCALGYAELEKLGIAKREDIVDATVVRMKKAYPVYDETYPAALAQARDFLSTLGNLQLVGRNGMHRYNNQDHSMLTAILAVRNIRGQGPFDLWQVNADADYHEDGFCLTEEEIQQMNASQPMTPGKLQRKTTRDHQG